MTANVENVNDENFGPVVMDSKQPVRVGVSHKEVITQAIDAHVGGFN